MQKLKDMLANPALHGFVAVLSLIVSAIALLVILL